MYFNTLRLLALLGVCLTLSFASSFAQKASDTVVDWPFALDEIDLNKDGLPSLWTYDAHFINDREEAVEVVAKTLSSHLEFGESAVYFELLRSTEDAHYRYQEIGAGDAPILGAQLNVHETGGHALRGSGQFVTPRMIGQMPAVQIDADKARSIAQRAVQSRQLRDAAELEATELWWVPRELDFSAADYELAYRVDVYSYAPLMRHYAYVNATTGEIVATQNRLHSTEEPGMADTRYSGRQPITTDLMDDGRYRLYQETTRNTIMHTRNLQNGGGGSFVDFFDDDNDWTGTNAAQDEAARDAHWGMERYHDLLTEFFGMRSIDNNGFNMIANVHLDFNYANAYWDGSTTNYGDGDPSSVLATPLTAIDIVAHEFTHGLTEFSAGLIYADESGALNESYSDIFGVATRFYARPDEQGNYAIGDEVDTQGIGIRDMADPTTQEHPGTYRGDFWIDGADVHYNSGVGNHWYYILSEGETGTNELGVSYNVPGIGWDQALEVAHLTLTSYLTPSSTYAEAAAMSVEAAGLLFGPCDDRTAQVAEAWKAVGLQTPSLAQGINFDASAQVICDLGEPIVFTALADTFPITWDFGDGNTATGMQVSHVYAPGTYTVTLYATGCDGVVDTLERQDLIYVDEDNPACDTLVISPTGSITERSCAGVVLDPGARENYPNGVNSEIVVLNPSGDALGYDLTINNFRLESSYDFLLIESILGGSRSQVGRFSGSDLTAGQVLSIPGEGFALTFTSDGSVTYEGFEIRYAATGGSVPVEAGLAIAQPEVTVFEPVLIEFTGVGTQATYDFGDGTIANFASSDEVRHAYSQAGMYTVTQYVRGCTNGDTATTSITVSAGTQVCATIDTAYITLLLGDSTTTSYTIQNCGGNPMVLSGLELVGSVDEESNQSYSQSAAATQHSFTSLPTIGNITTAELQLTYSGDYDGFDEYVTVILEDGTEISLEDDGNQPNDTEIEKTIPLTAAQVAAFLADGTMNVTVQNSSFVDTNLGGRDAHTVRLLIDGQAGDNISFDGPIPVAAGGSVNAILKVTSSGRSAGVHRFSESIQTNDAALPDGLLELPVVLTVLGRPLGEFDPAVLDLGQIYALRPAGGLTTLRSVGTDLLEITAVDVSGDGLTQDAASAFDLTPGAELPVLVEKVATTAGTFTDVITYTTNAGALTLTVIGEAVAVALMDVDATPIVDTLALDERRDYTLQVSSIGLLDLDLVSNAGIGSWWTHTSTNQEIPGGQEVTLTFTADATGLATGDYTSAIILRSNDPEQPTVTIPVSIYVLGRPTAGIGTLAAAYCGPTVAFTNVSTSDADEFTWMFGDGASSTDVAPSHVYGASGEYTVSLIACNESGCDTTAATITVETECEQIALDPSSPSSTTGCVGEVTDSGGDDGGYQNNEQFTLTINSGSDDLIELIPIVFETEGFYDVMHIYDGPDVTGPLLREWSGTLVNEPPVQSTQTSMTLAWRSDGSVTDPGFKLSWSCVEVIHSEERIVGEIAVFPNPANEQVVVTFPSDDLYSVEVLDALGRVALPAQQVASKQSLNVAPLPAGVYVLSIRSPQGATATKRLIIE